MNGVMNNELVDTEKTGKYAMDGSLWAKTQTVEEIAHEKSLRQLVGNCTIEEATIIANVLAKKYGDILLEAVENRYNELNSALARIDLILDENAPGK